MDVLAMPWANTRVAHLLVVHRMTPVEVGDNQEGKFNSNDDDPFDVYPESRNFRTFLFSHNTSKDREGLFGRMY